jgi:hypothetical protein
MQPYQRLDDRRGDQKTSNPARLSSGEVNDGRLVPARQQSRIEAPNLSAASAPQQMEEDMSGNPGTAGVAGVLGPAPSDNNGVRGANCRLRVMYPPLYCSFMQHVQIPGTGVSGNCGVQSRPVGIQWYELVEADRESLDGRSHVSGPSVAEDVSRPFEDALIDRRLLKLPAPPQPPQPQAQYIQLGVQLQQKQHQGPSLVLTPTPCAADTNAISTSNHELQVEEQEVPEEETSPVRLSGKRKRTAAAAGSRKWRLAAPSPGARRAQRPASNIAAATPVIPSPTGPAVTPAARTAIPANGPRNCLWNGCSTLLNGNVDLQRHLEDVHFPPEILKDDFGEGPKRCLWDRCIRKAPFTKRDHLVSHMETHHQNKAYVCPVCLKQFTRSGSKDIHLRDVKKCRDRYQQQQQQTFPQQQSHPQQQPPQPPQPLPLQPSQFQPPAPPQY